MLSLIETLLSLLTALISACFPRDKNNQEERPKNIVSPKQPHIQQQLKLQDPLRIYRKF